ncbi:MAG TPA: CHASE3 domain-containing protein, partial [Actinoplanes sp.]
MRVIDLRRWTLRRRIVALCVAVGLLLTALGIFAAFTAAAHNRQLDEALNRATPMRAAGESLNTALVDQETGIRGYAITGRAGNLAPYTAGQAEEQRLIALIESLLKPSDTAVRADLELVRQRAEAWHREIADPVV